MFHQPIQEQHSIRYGTKWGCLKIFLTANIALQMVRELPSGSVRKDRTIWVPYPSVIYADKPALKYLVDLRGVCHEQA